MDAVDLRLLQAQQVRCPHCRGLLLRADHEPQSPHDRQQWLTATRKAIQRHAATAETGPGTSDDTAAPQLPTAYPTLEWRIKGITSDFSVPGLIGPGNSRSPLQILTQANSVHSLSATNTSIPRPQRS